MYEDIRNRELARLDFILSSKGKEEVLAFAKQTKAVYLAARRAARRKINFYGAAYRVELVVSNIVLRNFINQQKGVYDETLHNNDNPVTYCSYKLSGAI